MKRNYKALTPEQKYELLTKDFLERDGDSFVRIRTSGRLGWENTLPEGGAYSAIMLNPKSEKELYMNAISLARQMIVSMNTPFKVNVKVCPNRSCTDSRTVYVATEVFDDENLTLGQKLDTFLGLTVHEASHLMWTDFKATTENKNRIIHMLQNIFEDERIERNLGEEKPGLANFLKATKYYYFGRYEKKQEEEQVDQLDDATRLFNAILGMVRFPATLNPKDVERFADELLQVRDILTPYPNSTKACIDAAKKVYELLKKFIANPPKDQNGQQRDDDQDEDQDESEDQNNRKNGKSDKGKAGKQSGHGNDEDESGEEEGDESEDGQGNDESESKEQEGDESEDGQASGNNDGNDSDNGKKSGKDSGETEGNENQDTDEQGDNGEKDDQSETDNGKGSSGDEEEEENEPLTDEEIDEILDSIIKAMEELSGHEDKKPGDGLDDDQVAEALKEDGDLLARECDGEIETGHVPGNVIVKQPANKYRYDQSYARVRKFIPAVAQALKCNGTSYSYNVTGTRSGLLDVNKLCEARQGVQNVYMRKGEVKADKLNVILVIDESGSMSGMREQLARDTAVLINEAAGNLKDIRLSIYGYSSAWYGAEIYPYREGNRMDSKHVLGSITSRNSTPTARTMNEITWRTRRESKEKGIAFIVSDGGADEGTRSVRAATDNMQKNGYQVIGISISSSLNKQTLSAMYDHYIVMDTLNNLASELGKTVKKAILNLSKRKVA